MERGVKEGGGEEGAEAAGVLDGRNGAAEGWMRNGGCGSGAAGGRAAAAVLALGVLLCCLGRFRAGRVGLPALNAWTAAAAGPAACCSLASSSMVACSCCASAALLSSLDRIAATDASDSSVAASSGDCAAGQLSCVAPSGVMKVMRFQC